LFFGKYYKRGDDGYLTYQVMWVIGVAWHAKKVSISHGVKMRVTTTELYH